MKKLKVLIICLMLFMTAATNAATYMPASEKVAIEAHLEDRLTKSLIPIVGEGNFVVVIDVLLNPERKETTTEKLETRVSEVRTVRAARGEVMPGLASNTEVSQVPQSQQTSKTVQSMVEIPENLITKISVVLLVDKKVTPAQIESMKKIAEVVLGIKKERKDTVTVQQVELNQMKALGTAAAGGGRPGFLTLDGILQYLAYFAAIVVVVFLFSGRMSGVTMTAVKALKEGGDKKDSGSAGIASALAAQAATAGGGEEKSSVSPAAYAAAAASGKVIIRPFSFITETETDKLIKVLEKEDSKVVADVVSSLDPKVSAKILSSMSDKLSDDTFSYIVADRELDRKSIDTLEDKIKSRIEGSIGGADDLLKILNNSSTSIAEKAIESLKKSNPEASTKIRAQMVLFSDIMALEDQMLIKVVMRSKIQDIAMVIQASDESIKEKFMKILPEESAGVVKEWLEMMPKQSDDVVEAAKRRLSNAAKQLEGAGEITINRG